MPIYSIVFNQDKALDTRVYNQPSVSISEVAAILVGERDKHDRERTLTVTHRFVDGYENFSTIKCTCPESDALQAPMYCSSLEEIWHFKKAWTRGTDRIHRPRPCADGHRDGPAEMPAWWTMKQLALPALKAPLHSSHPRRTGASSRRRCRDGAKRRPSGRRQST